MVSSSIVVSSKDVFLFVLYWLNVSPAPLCLIHCHLFYAFMHWGSFPGGSTGSHRSPQTCWGKPSAPCSGWGPGREHSESSSCPEHSRAPECRERFPPPSQCSGWWRGSRAGEPGSQRGKEAGVERDSLSQGNMRMTSHLSGMYLIQHTLYAVSSDELNNFQAYFQDNGTFYWRNKYYTKHWSKTLHEFTFGIGNLQVPAQ